MITANKEMGSFLLQNKRYADANEENFHGVTLLNPQALAIEMDLPGHQNQHLVIATPNPFIRGIVKMS